MKTRHHPLASFCPSSIQRLPRKVVLRDLNHQLQEIPSATEQVKTSAGQEWNSDALSQFPMLFNNSPLLFIIIIVSRPPPPPLHFISISLLLLHSGFYVCRRAMSKSKFISIGSATQDLFNGLLTDKEAPEFGFGEAAKFGFTPTHSSAVALQKNQR